MRNNGTLDASVTPKARPVPHGRKAARPALSREIARVLGGDYR